MHEASFRSVATHPLGDVLLTGSIDSTCRLYDLDNLSGRYLPNLTLTHHKDSVLCVTPMVSGLGFFTGGRDNIIKMVDLEGTLIREFKGHEQAVNSLH
jgi:WD40 repeat protein